MKKRTEGEIKMILETVEITLENDTKYTMTGVSVFRDNDPTSQVVTLAVWDELMSEMDDVTGDAPKHDYKEINVDVKDLDDMIGFFQQAKKWVNKG